MLRLINSGIVMEPMEDERKERNRIKKGNDIRKKGEKF